MCFTCSQNQQRKKKKIYRVYPEPPLPSFTTDEIIQCAACEESFNLLDIKINCAGCNKFFHCRIAGTCYGNKCLLETSDGILHRARWCIDCVPPIPENNEKQNKNENCICKDCYQY